MLKTPTDKVPSSPADKDATLERKRIYARKYYRKNKEKIALRRKEYMRQWHIENKEKIVAKATKWNKEHPERRREIRLNWNGRNMEKRKAWNKEYRLKKRQLVIEHYSKGSNDCNCCGEKLYQFLTIDHIAGGGNKHRVITKTNGGHHFYTWLIKNDYPAGFQVLCFNCNMAKGFFGVCPHTL